MSIVGGFDVHRRQITFDYVDTDTGRLQRGRITPACRGVLRRWLVDRFAGRTDVQFAVEACTGWRFLVEECQRAGIEAHLADGEMTPGSEIGLRVDQTLTQDATGTMVMLELEALGLDRARTQVSVQYVDHNLLQADERNMADHLFLRSACQRFGLWYSKPGNGVSHPVHM